MTPRFELKGVSKYYSKTDARGKRFRFAAVDNLDLTLNDGCIEALVGESGCGKSTLAMILVRLTHYDEGELFYLNKPLSKTPIKDFRNKNQILFQNPYLSVNPTFTIFKILSEPLRIAKQSKREIMERCNVLLELLELPHSYLSRRPSEVSGGELQRVVLGRAMALEPEYIILDEPFKSLDEITARRLIRHFKDIFRQTGMGGLLISHNREHVSLLAENVFQMQRGKIISQSSL